MAVHGHLGLRERLDDQELERAREQLRLLGGEREREMPRQEPLRHQRHLAQELVPVVGRELPAQRPAAHLDGSEHGERILVERLGVIARLEPLEIQRPAEILEQQESARDVGLVHVRDVRPERREQPRHLQVRPHVLLGGRRIHHDVGAPVAERAEVAPEARIARCGLDARYLQAQLARQPIPYQRNSRVGLKHVRVMGFPGRSNLEATL